MPASGRRFPSRKTEAGRPPAAGLTGAFHIARMKAMVRVAGAVRDHQWPGTISEKIGGCRPTIREPEAGGAGATCAVRVT